MTQELLDNTELPLSERAWKSIRAEHGATIGLQARTKVYAGVRRDHFDSEDIVNIRELFNEAKDVLEHGNNGYFGASNAIHAAAFERVVGHKGTIKWLGEAMLSASTAQTLRDCLSATRTVLANGLYIPSAKATKRKILTRP